MSAPGFERFARAQHDQLVGMLSLYCGERDVAEELAHEALIRAREHWDEVRDMDAPGAWLHRVSINLANSHFRRRRARRRAYERHARTSPRTPDPDSADRIAVRAAVADLSRRQRETIVLRYYLGYPVADTARLLGLSPSAVKTYTRRAVQQLRDELADSTQEVRA